MSVHKSSDNHSATKELKEIKKLLENKREDNMSNSNLPSLRVSRKEAKNKIDKQIEKGNKFISKDDIHTTKMLPSARIEYDKWYKYNCTLLNSLFSDASIHDEYTGENDAVSITIYPQKNGEQIESYYRNIKNDIESLESIVERLPLYNESINEKVRKHIETPVSKDVFIIHGHDRLSLLELEKMLKEEFKLNPIVLKDKAGKSRTIIEKFEEQAEPASYAIGLFTSDDFIESDEEAKGVKYTQARPNVIFELGWFYGKLGRGKTLILLKKGTKLHSDLAGIEYKEFNISVKEIEKDIKMELEEAGLL